jgi:hypothetical protein
MLFTDLFESFDAGSLNVGDPVIITGNVQFQGKTGDVAGFGKDKRFVIVDLYNHGKQSFNASDVEYNDYAGSDDEVEHMDEAAENPYQQRILDSDPEALEEFLTTGYLDTTSDLYNQMYDYYANQMPERVRRNMDKQYEFITSKIREITSNNEELDEGYTKFGAYYAEQLAKKVFDERPHFQTKGNADELIDYAWRFAVQDLGKSRARYEFNYDEDFLSDFVSAYGWLQDGGNPETGEDGLEEGWKQTLAGVGAAAALGLGGMAAMGGQAPTTGGPEIANPQQVVQQIKAGKITNANDLQAVLSTAKNKNQVWAVLQNAAGMQGSSDADAVVQHIAGNTQLQEGMDIDRLAGIIAAGLERMAPNVFSEYGIEFVLEAVRDVAEFYAMSDFDELGTSDIGAMVRSVIRDLKRREAHMNKGA